MKNFYVLPLVAFTITCLPGCQKLYDYVENHPDADIKDCPITQIIFTPFGASFYDTLVFSYNSFGDPVSVTNLPRPGTGAPNWVFKYDKKHRLTDVIGMYGNGIGGEFWHRYFYENPGSSNIILDSAYSFPLIVNGILTPDPHYNARASYLTYDKKGRIIKDSAIDNTPFFNPFVTINNYSYDAAGNLTSRSYDDKINIHRTNKIWMFFDRDYSVNNPFVANSYNSIGLPTRFNFPAESGQFMKFLYFFSNNVVITYKCK